MDSATALQTIFTALPASFRKAIYKVVKIISAILTLALLILPAFPQVGITLPDSDRYVAIFTGALTLLGHLADSNTNTDPLVDVNPAPEPGDPEVPEGVVDPGTAELAAMTSDSDSASDSSAESNTSAAAPDASALLTTDQPAPAPPAA